MADTNNPNHTPSSSSTAAVTASSSSPSWVNLSKLVTELPRKREMYLEEVYGHSNKNKSRSQKSVRFGVSETGQIGLAAIPHPRPNIQLIRCKYSDEGCTELLERGTILEKDHYETCEYRPLPCIVGHDGHGNNCEPIPYRCFTLHLATQHFLQPTFTANLCAKVVVFNSDFEEEKRFLPKWIRGCGADFFLNLWRKESGIWSSWVSVYGPPRQASHFLAKITYFKGLKSFGGTYPVHSVTADQKDLQRARSILLTCDTTVREVSQIHYNYVTDFSVNVQIVPNILPPHETDEHETEIEPKQTSSSTEKNISEILSSSTEKTISEILSSSTEKNISEILASSTEKTISEILPSSTMKAISEILEEVGVDVHDFVGSSELLQYLGPPSTRTSVSSVNEHDLEPLSTFSIEQRLARSIAPSTTSLVEHSDRGGGEQMVGIASAPAALGISTPSSTSSSEVPVPTSGSSLLRRLSNAIPASSSVNLDVEAPSALGISTPSSTLSSKVPVPTSSSKVPVPTSRSSLRRSSTSIPASSSVNLDVELSFSYDGLGGNAQ